MNINWLNNIEDQLLNYLYSLQDNENVYHFLPARSSLTEAGKTLTLGFSCYSMKLHYILNLFTKINMNSKEWTSYINSFQKNSSFSPENSYIDDSYVKQYNKFNLSKSFKSVVKTSLNLSGQFQYESKNTYFEKSIRAETKQAIASLSQLDVKSKFKYNDFPQTNSEINSFLDSYDWTKPWDAGAQFSGICVFTSTQLEEFDKSKLSIENYIGKLASQEYGLYYKEKLPNKNEAINGAMKVISGLDWLDIPIHYPEKLIDFCLLSTPDSTGCDLVDYVYVLYKCSEQTKYRKKEIVIYCEELLKLIENHFYAEGGFSYYIGKSQTHYYGVKITQDYNQPDIHGTLLFVWALSMIFNLIESSKFDWKVIKP